MSNVSVLDLIPMLMVRGFSLLHLAITEVQNYSTSATFPCFASNQRASSASMPVIVAGDFNVQLTLDDGSVPPEMFAWKAQALPFINQVKYAQLFTGLSCFPSALSCEGGC